MPHDLELRNEVESVQDNASMQDEPAFNQETSQSQNYYAIDQLERAVQRIKQAETELANGRKRLEKHKENKKKAFAIYETLKNFHTSLVSALGDIRPILHELEMPELSAFAEKLLNSVKAFNLMTPDYTKLCAAINQLLDKLPVSDNQTVNAQVIGRLMNHVRMGYYPTDLGHIDHLVRGIDFPEDITINLLDPCCGCGLALQRLGADNNSRTFGVELDHYRAEEAQRRLDRVGIGSYYHSKISHESFHAMLLNPPYLSVLNENGFNTRSEKRFLSDSIGHLMYGGFMAYIIPYYRLTEDICRMLCDNFSDISLWRFDEGEFKKFKQVCGIGVTKEKAGRTRASTGFS